MVLPLMSVRYARSLTPMKIEVIWKEGIDF